MLFDDILREIGEFGCYQICVYLVMGTIGISAGWMTMGLTFFAASMDHWCEVDQLVEFPHGHQKYIAIPDDEDDSEKYSQCYMYNLNYSAYTSEDFYNWNRSNMVDENTTTIKCQSWVYDQSEFVSSLVSQMDLVCDDTALISLLQTLYVCGILFGCLIFGQMSDMIGRKVTLLSALVGQVVFATAAAFTPYYIGYAIFRTLIGATSGGGVYMTMFVMCMEVIGPRFRIAMGLMVQAWFAIGLMSLPWMSYAVRDHIKLQFICAVSPCILWLMALTVSESPRWLVAEGKDPDAIVVIDRIALINKTTVPEKLDLEDNRKAKEATESVKKSTLLDLLRTSNLRKITLNMWFAWFVVSLVYYGLSFGVVGVGGNIFMNSFISGAVEIPAYILCIFVLEFLGRRWPTVFAFGLTGVFTLISIAFLDNDDYATELTVFIMLGKFFIAGAFAIIYVYAAEVFPTIVRQIGLGSSSMCARIGGIVQPQITYLGTYWSPFPYIVYGVTAIMAGVFAIFLPETKGTMLPESVEDAENLGKKNVSKEMTGEENSGFDTDGDDYDMCTKL